MAVGIPKQIKSMAQGLMRRWGYEVRSVRWRPQWNPPALAELSSPVTVIDVGAANGTPKLYEAFPDAYYLLVEPLKEFEPALQKLTAGELRGEYFLGAAGAEEGSAVIRVERDESLGLTKSSLHERTGYSLAGKIYDERTIPVKTLDQLVATRRLKGPFVLKIDTEGHELEVLAGATEMLKETDIVIAETAIVQRFAGSYQFADYVRFMDEHDFELYGIVHVAAKPGSHQITYLDTIFRHRSASRSGRGSGSRGGG